MHRIRNVVAAAGGVALLAAASAAPAADIDPPLPLTVKQRLIELTAAPTTASRGRCVNGEAMRALISAAPAYADEIALFATRRLRERAPRADEDCSCLIDLTRAIGGAMPERSASFSRLVAEQAPACGGVIIRGIDDSPGGSGGIAMEGRPVGGGAVARSACATSRACATPLLRPRSDLIGPTRLGGDS
jgi:hypothetical protein